MNKWITAIVIAALVPITASAQLPEPDNFQDLTETMFNQLLPIMEFVGTAIFFLAVPYAVVSGNLSLMIFTLPLLFLPKVIETLLIPQSTLNLKETASKHGDQDLSDKLISISNNTSSDEVSLVRDGGLETGIIPIVLVALGCIALFFIVKPYIQNRNARRQRNQITPSARNNPTRAADLAVANTPVETSDASRSETQNILRQAEHSWVKNNSGRSSNRAKTQRTTRSQHNRDLDIDSGVGFIHDPVQTVRSVNIDSSPNTCSEPAPTTGDFSSGDSGGGSCGD